MDEVENHAFFIRNRHSIPPPRGFLVSTLWPSGLSAALPENHDDNMMAMNIVAYMRAMLGPLLSGHSLLTRAGDREFRAERSKGNAMFVAKGVQR